MLKPIVGIVSNQSRSSFPEDRLRNRLEFDPVAELAGGIAGEEAKDWQAAQKGVCMAGQCDYLGDRTVHCLRRSLADWPHPRKRVGLKAAGAGSAPTFPVRAPLAEVDQSL